jgi:hypothetical protein
MSEKKEKLCKWEKRGRMEREFEAYTRIVIPPKFICKKCGRVANSEEWLHRPVPLGQD